MSMQVRESDMPDNFRIDEPVAGVKRITINRPDSMNAFTFGMYKELADLLHQIKYEPRTRVVILTAIGKAFCTGHDLKAGGTPDWVPRSEERRVGKEWKRRP